MTYKKIHSEKMSLQELKMLWKDEYCDPSKPVVTFDGIVVRFQEQTFDHVFYESANRKAKDKSILSLNRLQKMLWIKDVLQDRSAVLKQGWDRDSKKYDQSRRVALVRGNYIVVIRLTSSGKASFVTAYEVNDDNNLQKILSSPDYKP